MKRLIVNADDFGMTAGVNRAVVEAHQHGIVTSATLMATGRAAAEAAAIAKSTPNLDVGAHIVLLEGTPALEPNDTPSLTTQMADGRAAFQRGFGAFVSAALTERIAADDIYRETLAQIERLRQLGVELSHLDTHKHAHAFPGVFHPFLRAAAEAGVRAVRNPYEPFWAMGGAILRTPRLWTRYVPVHLMAAFASEFRLECRRMGLVTTDGALGITLTGYMDQRSLETLLGRIPEGTWELLCHPAYEDEEWWTLGPRRGSGAAELNVLTSPETRHTVEKLGIRLITYREISAEHGTAAA